MIHRLDPDNPSPDRDPDLERAAARRQRRRRRAALIRERGRAAMVRGVHFLPSLATLGNVLCGFSAMYACTFASGNQSYDPWARALLAEPLLTAVYLILFAAFFDVLDGRLARMTRHTTDFGGQLDSLADVISFGCAPAFICLQLFHRLGDVPLVVTRLVWCLGMLYVACAAIRLARFNVTNVHAEQAHRSFQGLPSPAAAMAALAVVLVHEELALDGYESAARTVIWGIIPVLLSTALLMVSELRYPHLMNTMLRGRKSVFKLVAGLIVILLLVLRHRYVIAFAALAFLVAGPLYWWQLRRASAQPKAPTPAV
ncbi:MAG: CDP-alcohol phosphatidyltransferase family protein [Tepidisphaeraceae bacterium]